MFLTAKLTKTKSYYKKINNLRKKLLEAEKNKIYVGYFDDQGNHPLAGIRYVDLMAIHEFGAPKVGIPSRPVLNLAQNGGVFSSKDKQVIRQALKGVFVKNIPLSSAYESIGKYYRQKAYDIFGSYMLLPTVKGNDPLIESENLRENIQYRTSFTYKVSPV